MKQIAIDTPRRVEWKERRGAEWFFVVAEHGDTQWEFWERESWEVRYYRIAPTDKLRAHLDTVLRTWPERPVFREP